VIQTTLNSRSLSLSLTLFVLFLIASDNNRSEKIDQELKTRFTREIGKNSATFTTAKDISGKWWTRAGRLQGLRAPPQINISFQPRQSPTATRLFSSFPLLFLHPLCCLPFFVLCRFSLAISRAAIPVVFNPAVFFCYSYSTLMLLLLYFFHRLSLASYFASVSSHARSSSNARYPELCLFKLIAMKSTILQ